MSRLDNAVAHLAEVLKDYDALDHDMRRIVTGWQRLDPEARRMVGGLAPDLIDAVIAVEGRARRLISA